MSGVELAPLRAADSELLFEWINDRDLVVRSAPFRPVSRTEHDAWFDDIRSRDDVRIFGIRLQEDDRLVGTCQLHDIHRAHRSAELQIRIGSADARGRGIGTAATVRLLEVGFHELGLHRVYLHVLATNEPARRLYERVGFRVEGVQRAAAWIEGEWVDLLLLAILAGEFPVQRVTLVAIHQPTFLPWLGWWDKLVRADVFVLLDDVQFPKKGGSWVNRVRLLVDREPRWVTVPVDRTFHGTRSVREMRIDSAKPWRKATLRTVTSSYGRAPHFAAVMPIFEEALAVETERIAELDEHAIRCFAGPLGVDASRLVRQSDLGVAGAGTELLVDLCRAVGGDTYLSGDGAGEYLDKDVFVAAGLGLAYQQFTPPQYLQPAPDYVPGLSVVDALMSCGWEGTATLLRRR